MHLILHKVRGEAAFDVAEECDIGSEKGWIIPTSGHRAYPLIAWNMAELLPSGIQVSDFPTWPSLPDHYAANDIYRSIPSETKPRSKFSIDDL